MLKILNSAARWWLDWRQDRRVEQAKRENPEAFEWKLKKVEVDGHGWNVVLFAPSIVELAHEAVALLNAEGAKSYVEFSFMPRLDRGTRAVRVTVQFADGESPAAKASRLEEELVEYKLLH